MEFQVVIPVLISFAISVVLGPVIIPFLRRLKMGQTERTEGVQSHLKKAGTPTMGGVIFLIATAITALFYVGDYPKIIPVLFLTLGFGIIGFLDDYLKVVLKRSDGLLPWQKFLLQVVLTAIFVFYIVKYTDISLTMRIPFWSGHFLNLGWLAVPVLFFAVIGTVNGVNFTPDYLNRNNRPQEQQAAPDTDQFCLAVYSLDSVSFQFSPSSTTPINGRFLYFCA